MIETLNGKEKERERNGKKDPRVMLGKSSIKKLLKYSIKRAMHETNTLE